MTKLITALMALTLTACCTNSDPATWNQQELDSWFTASPWQELTAKPAAATDLRQFAVQSHRNAQAWQAALEFFQRNDLQTLAVGNYPLTEEGTYAAVSEYMTKDSAAFECHRKFIDIQFVASGQEQIWVTPTDSLTACVTPYDPQRDIAFYTEAPAWEARHADSSVLHILFPSDGHKPCMQIGQQAPIRKIVVKIPYVE